MLWETGLYGSIVDEMREVMPRSAILRLVLAVVATDEKRESLEVQLNGTGRVIVLQTSGSTRWRLNTRQQALHRPQSYTLYIILRFPRLLSIWLWRSGGIVEIYSSMLLCFPPWCDSGMLSMTKTPVCEEKTGGPSWSLPCSLSLSLVPLTAGFPSPPLAPPPGSSVTFC